MSWTVTGTRLAKNWSIVLLISGLKRVLLAVHSSGFHWKTYVNSVTFACCELYVCRGVAWKSCRYWCFWSMVVHLPAIKHRTFYCSIQTVLFLVLPINFLTLWQSYGTLNFVQFILAHPILAKCDMYKYWMMQSFPCMCLYTHSNPVLNILHSAHLTDLFPHGVIIG